MSWLSGARKINHRLDVIKDFYARAFAKSFMYTWGDVCRPSLDYKICHRCCYNFSC